MGSSESVWHRALDKRRKFISDIKRDYANGAGCGGEENICVCGRLEILEQ